MLTSGAVNALILFPGNPGKSGRLALLMKKTSSDCKLHNCKHLMGGAIALGVPESSDRGNRAHPCGSLEATMELLQKKDSVLWEMGLLSQEGPTPTFADLLLAPNSVFLGLCLQSESNALLV